MVGSTTSSPRVFRRLGWQLLSPTVVSGLTLVVLFAVWTYYQVGGMTMFTFNGYAVLATSLALAAAGTTIVLLTGGYDLSSAGVISLTNALAATQMHGSTGRIVVVIALVIFVGTFVGALNGLTVAVAGLESIATTLAMFIVLGGVALLVLPAPGGEVPASISSAITGVVGGVVPVALLILGGLVILWLAIVRTRFGVALFAIGENEQASYMSGLPTRRVKVGAYALAGLMYALAGLYYSFYTGTGDPTSGTPFLITTFAAVALGGASFAGGRASVIGTVIGAALLMVIPKLLFALGAGDYWSGLIQGIIIITAVVFGIISARIRDRQRGAQQI